MFERVAASLAAICCTLSLLTGSASAAGPPVLRIGLVQQPNSLDPLHAIEFYENFIDEAIFDGLVVIDDRGEPSPDLAQSVPTRANGGISKDGKTLTYRLRPGVRWQDGVPLTSHDVAYTFRRMMDPASNFTEVSVYSAIERIDTPDERTVVVRLRAPWADAVTELFVNGQNGSILPAHVLEHVADLNRSGFESQPVGSGPYALERWDRGNKLVLRANPAFFRGKPHLDRIDFEFVPDANTLAIRVRTGELDFSPQITAAAALQLRGRSGLTFRAVPTYAALELLFNTTAAPYDDVRVREALALAVDRERLASTSYRGLALPADDLVPSASPFHVSDPSVRQSGDAPAAARLLDASGWRVGIGGVRQKNGKPLEAALIVPAGYATIVSAAVQIQAAWRALGIDATIRPLQSNTILAQNGPLARGDFGIELSSTGYATSPDRSQFITSGAIAPNGRNYSRIRDAVLDRQTLAARVEFDPAKRIALYAEISRRERQLAAIVPLLWVQQPYLYDARLTGLRPEPINSDLWNVYDWQFAR